MSRNIWAWILIRFLFCMIGSSLPVMTDDFSSKRVARKGKAWLYMFKLIKPEWFMRYCLRSFDCCMTSSGTFQNRQSYTHTRTPYFNILYLTSLLYLCRLRSNIYWITNVPIWVGLTQYLKSNWQFKLVNCIFFSTLEN